MIRPPQAMATTPVVLNCKNQYDQVGNLKGPFLTEGSFFHAPVVIWIFPHSATRSDLFETQQPA